MLYKAQYMNTNPAMMANWFSSCAGQIFQKPCFLVKILWPHRFDLVHMYEIRPTAANFQIRSFYKIMTDHKFSPRTRAWFTHATTTSGCPKSMLILIHLGWQCRQMCLSAAPVKRQTFLSVADMSEMSSQHVGDILLCRPILRLSASCRWDLFEVVTTHEEIRKIGIHSDFSSTRKYLL